MLDKLPKATLRALEFEQKTLSNGLQIRLLPMPEYGGAHVIYATRYGSVDREFIQDGKTVRLPAGVAHFLEHKMFENEDGVDAFALYSETGASANAYTSFEQTAYIFSATDEIERNLDILLSLVGKPYFTPETIAKEQGIIAQEIKMYQDTAEFRVFFSLLENLYHTHPVRDDIAGTVESISEITPEMLYSCCEAFYNPSNMVLCAAGNITMKQLTEAVDRAGLPEKKAGKVERVRPEEPQDILRKSSSFRMAVSLPMFAIGFKEKPVEENDTKLEVVCDILTEMLVGETSLLYRRLYDEGLVQPGFSGEFSKMDGCLYFMFSGESANPELVQELLLQEIERQRSEGIDKEQFEVCKKMLYGESISDLENVDAVANMLSNSYFRDRTPAEELAAVAAVTAEDVQQALDKMLKQERCSIAVARPNQ